MDEKEVLLMCEKKKDNRLKFFRVLKGKNFLNFTWLFVLMFFFIHCRKEKDEDPPASPSPPVSPFSDISNTYGFGIFSRIRGIWNGPVSSSTPLGNYPEWIVDFRPVSAAQVSSKNELDSLNDIHMSFFIVKYNKEYRVCFRNGGSFAGQTRVSYFLADSVKENPGKSYYRFSEIKKGKKRAYTEVIFRSDSVYIKSYTNKYNTLNSPVLHMSWNAKLQDTTSCQPALQHFGYPKKTLIKDFSTTFAQQNEAVYYSVTGGDPYPENQQPYLGKTHVFYSYAPFLAPDPSKKVFIVITTQPLISGLTFQTANLKFRSRYVVLASSDPDFVFNYMHPGSYYLYAIYDADDNKTLSSGDWVSASNTTFSLSPSGTTTVSAQINFVIP